VNDQRVVLIVDGDIDMNGAAGEIRNVLVCVCLYMVVGICICFDMGIIYVYSRIKIHMD